MRTINSKIVPFAQLEDLSDKLHQFDGKIVSTNGCFDLLHWGHIQYLNEARNRGDCLVVGLNSDASVRRLKGSARPLHAEAIRASQVAALECVDYVTIFEEDTPERFLRLLRPAIHIKGGDYSGRELPESRVLQEMGSRLELIDFVPGYSTTGLLDTLQKL